MTTDRIHKLRIEYEETASPSASLAPAGVHVSTVGGVASPSPSTALGGPETVTVESVFPVPFSAELPSTIDPGAGYPGWREDGITPGYASFVYVRDADSTPAYVTLYIPAGVFRDPCHPDEGMSTTSAEPGVDELVEALTSQVGVRAGPVTDIAFGDHRGKTFELDNNIDERPARTIRGCASGRTAPTVSTATSSRSSEGLSNTHQRIAIVDVDGTPVLIEAWDLKANRDEVAELYRLFESIRFE